MEGQVNEALALPKIFSEDQLAETFAHVGVTVRLIQEHRRAGWLKCIAFSKKKFGYPEEAVADWLASLTDKCHASKRTKFSNIGGGGLSASLPAPSTMVPDTTRLAEESAARVLAQTILKPPKKP
jgi:hypothetical protein